MDPVCPLKGSTECFQGKSISNTYSGTSLHTPQPPGRSRLNPWEVGEWSLPHAHPCATGKKPVLYHQVLKLPSWLSDLPSHQQLREDLGRRPRPRGDSPRKAEGPMMAQVTKHYILFSSR